MPDAEKTAKIIVTEVEILLDPTVVVYEVVIEGEKSVWKETIPSKELLDWFLRGVQAGASMYAKQYVSLPVEYGKSIRRLAT